MRRELDSSSLQISIYNSTQHARDFRYPDKGLTYKIVRIDGLMLGERMIARQDHDKRLLRYYFVFEIGFLFPAEESDIKLPALQVVCERCRVVARNPDFDIEQFVAKDACGPRQPIDFLPGLEAHGESRFGRLRGTPRRFRGCLGLSKRQPCMVEEGAPGGGQFDAVHAAAHKLDADLIFEIADLSTEKAAPWAAVSPPPASGCPPRRPRRNSEGAVTLAASISARHAPKLTKSFSMTPAEPTWRPTKALASGLRL